jgi:uncharacterized protein YlaI
MEIKKCYICDKDMLSKDEIGLNKKLLGRNIVKFFCSNCLANYLEITLEELLIKEEEFKAQGCKLFE